MNPSSENHLKETVRQVLLSILLISTFISNLCCNDTGSSLKPNKTISFSKTDIEIPNVSENLIIKHEGYSFQYSELDEQPLWVAYMLTTEEVYCTTSRTDDFREDSTILSGSATNEDYLNSGYVRGHLKPAADSRFSRKEMSESFLLSNISPMLWDFNEGIWLDLEKRIRDWAVVYDSLFVVTGPLFLDSLKSIGNNRVSIPSHFYKAAVEVSGEEYRSVAFIIAHKADVNKPIDSLKVSIDSLEVVLKIDLFYNLPDTIEEVLEAGIEINLTATD